MQHDSDRVAPVFERGYPSFEAVNNINDKDSNQERYHNYILRRLREEDEAYQRQERSGSSGDD